MPTDEDWTHAGPPGSTPLDPDEADGLKPEWVATRDDLNEVEQANILNAVTARRWRTITVAELLDDQAVRDLHRDMFGEVWTWAGQYRRSEKNIGVDPTTISVRVRDLMDDAKAWLGGSTPLPIDQVGYELHHRMVAIHPFANGNGRHAREITNTLLRALGHEPFTWGRRQASEPAEVRARYIAALRAADSGDYEPLARFVRS